MSERPDELIVIGKTTITAHEEDCLQTFGYFMHELGQKLLIMPTKGAVTAVMTGYLEAGGVPTNLERGPLPHNDVIVFLNTPLERALDLRMPDWLSRPWIVIADDQIDDFTATYLDVVDTMGIKIVE